MLRNNKFGAYHARSILYLILTFVKYKVDTVSDHCKESSSSFKLDSRIVARVKGAESNFMTGEFTSPKTTTEGKLYNDRVKSVLASKCSITVSNSFSGT